MHCNHLGINAFAKTGKWSQAGKSDLFGATTKKSLRQLSKAMTTELGNGFSRSNLLTAPLYVRF